MSEAAIALVFSPEPWVEHLHRHCADHGGARVRQVVVDPRVALDEPYDTLVVSHRWPSLTPALVAALHARRRRVLGVHDPTEPAAREHLQRVGVDAVLPADAPMAAFLDAVAELGVATAPAAASPAPASSGAGPLGSVVAVGGTSGAGATEIAIELARHVASQGRDVVLVDVDDGLPSITPRLGLPIEPNLRTAIDRAVYDGDALDLVSVPLGRRRLHVLGGMPSTTAWAQVRPDDVLLVLERLAEEHHVVVANVGSRLELVGDAGHDRFGTSRAVVGVADALVGVTLATPLGVVRGVGWAAEARAFAPACALWFVANRAPRDGFRRGEVVTELARSLEARAVDVVPEDARVGSAAWSQGFVARGPFTRAVARLARNLPGCALDRGGLRTTEPVG